MKLWPRIKLKLESGNCFSSVTRKRRFPVFNQTKLRITKNITFRSAAVLSGLKLISLRTWMLRTALFGVNTQWVVVISYRRFGTTCQLGQKGCLEISVRNYHYSLRNDPEERSSQLLRGGSLKSRSVIVVARESEEWQYSSNHRSKLQNLYGLSVPIGGIQFVRREITPLD